MNPKLLLTLALAAVTLSAPARLMQYLGDAEMLRVADLVVIARPVQTRDLDETNSLGFSSTPTFQSRFRGVETTFKISAVLKGSPATDQIILHHYRFETNWGCPPNGPTLITFDPAATNQLVLYLVRDGPTRYAPAVGQMDPGISFKPAARVLNSTNQNLTQQISAILTQCQQIKPGQTRADLLKNFTTEGGLSTTWHRTYVSRTCPYVKLAVEFFRTSSATEEHPTDIILKISQPYLDWTISD